MPKALTAKQEAFVNAYILTQGNGVQAAKLAGYKGDDRSLAATASRTLTVASVQKAVESLRRSLYEHEGLSPEYLLRKLYAFLETNPADPVPALRLGAQIKGMVVDRREIKGTVYHGHASLDKLSTDDLERLVSTVPAPRKAIEGRGGTVDTGTGELPS